MLSLNDEMTNLLLECLRAHRPELIPIVDSDELIAIDADLGNQLRDAVCDEFLQVGLEKNDEPNELGLKLEHLIDLIGRMFM